MLRGERLPHVTNLHIRYTGLDKEGAVALDTVISYGRLPCSLYVDKTIGGSHHRGAICHLRSGRLMTFSQHRRYTIYATSKLVLHDFVVSHCRPRGGEITRI